MTNGIVPTPVKSRLSRSPAYVWSKYWPPVSRIDGAGGDRNLICACPPLVRVQPGLTLFSPLTIPYSSGIVLPIEY